MAAKEGNRDLELLFEMGTLKNVDRTWRQTLGMECANDLEHSFRVAFIALILARRSKAKISEEKLLKMALVHDLPETRTGDLNYMHKVYATTDEERAGRDMFAGTSLGDLFADVFLEYEKRESLESKLIKDADNLDVDVELKELEERGSQLAKKFAATRRIVRDKKLHTEAAKRFWDELQKADPAAWHLKSNKWYKMPGTGR